MLPHFTGIALYEQASSVFRQDVRSSCGSILAHLILDGSLHQSGTPTDGLSRGERQPWVVLLATNAPGYLISIFFVIFFTRHSEVFVIFVVGPASLPIARVQ